MLSHLRRLFWDKPEAIVEFDPYPERMAIYEHVLGEPEQVFRDTDIERIDVLAFSRNFAPEHRKENDYGSVLITNGMSNQRMNLSQEAQIAGNTPRAELVWYVPEVTPEIVSTLRWLARLPFIDNTWFSFGHRIPMPSSPVSGCPFRTFLLLTPVSHMEQFIASELRVEEDSVELLTVNLISDEEYDFLKTRGMDDFLDLLDENDHPMMFDPKRTSYV